jgi:phasin
VAKDKEPFEAFTATADQTAEQITKQARRATETYFSWVQNAMSVFPWSSTDLNRKLLNYATENVTTAVNFMQKLGHAKNPEDVVKIQTEFLEKQIKSFSEQAKTVGEITQAAANAMTKPFDMSR